MLNGRATTDAVEGHPDDLAAWCDPLLQNADRFAGDLEHHAGAVVERFRGRQRVENGAKRAHDRNANFLHLGDDRRLRAAQAESENPENLVALDLLFGRRDGPIGPQPVIVDRHRNFVAVDTATVIERLYVQVEALPRRRVRAGQRPGKICDVADLIVLGLRGRRTEISRPTNVAKAIAIPFIQYIVVLPKH